MKQSRKKKQNTAYHLPIFTNSLAHQMFIYFALRLGVVSELQTDCSEKCTE